MTTPNGSVYVRWIDTLLSIFALVFTVSAVQADSTRWLHYTIAAPGYLPAGSEPFSAVSQVVGWAFLDRSHHRVHLYLSRGTAIRCLGKVTRWFDEMHFIGMNSRGQVLYGWHELVENPVGTGDHFEGETYLYSRGKTINLWDNQNDCVVGEGLNDRGEIVGSTKIGVGYSHAFQWRHGKLQNLFNRDEATTPDAAHGVNNRGDVAGALANQPFVLHHGRLIPLKGFKGTYGGEALSVNERRQTAGYVWSNSPVRENGYGPRYYQLACLWTPHRSCLLGTLPGAIGSEAHGLNNRGQVVGESGNRAFLWQGGKLIDLNKLIRKTARFALVNAESINDRGQIVVEALQGNVPRRFLLTPVPL